MQRASCVLVITVLYTECAAGRFKGEQNQQLNRRFQRLDTHRSWNCTLRLPADPCDIQVRGWSGAVIS